MSMKYTERLAEAGVEPSVGSVGDSYDNALAETVIGLFKTEVIHRRGPWRSFEAVEFATLEWVDFRNGAVVVKHLEPTRVQHDAVRPLARRSDVPVSNHSSRRARGCCPQVVFPSRDSASVRGRLYDRHTMPRPRAVPARPSGSRARNHRPATVDPSASSGTASRRGTSEIRRFTRGQFILFGNAPATRSVYAAAAATVASRVKRNSVPSRHIRCSTTPIRRAKPTVARFFPRR